MADLPDLPIYMPYSDRAKRKAQQNDDDREWAEKFAKKSTERLTEMLVKKKQECRRKGCEEGCKIYTAQVVCCSAKNPEGVRNMRDLASIFEHFGNDNITVRKERKKETTDNSSRLRSRYASPTLVNESGNDFCTRITHY